MPSAYLSWDGLCVEVSYHVTHDGVIEDLSVDFVEVDDPQRFSETHERVLTALAGDNLSQLYALAKEHEAR